MNQEPIRACILGATFNTNNMGVSMLAAGAIRCILHRFPEARVTMLDYAQNGYDFAFPFDGKPIPVRFLNIRFSKKVYLANNIALLIALTLVSKVIPSKTLRRKLLDRNECMKQVLQTDVFFALSGGDSFSDIYGIGRFLYVALPQLLALFAGKRLIFLPQTIGPFRSGIVKAIAKFIMRRAELIYSRDHLGVAATRQMLGLQNTNGNGKLNFCYDLAFDVEPLRPADISIDGLPDLASLQSPVVGFNVSGLLLAGGYTRNNMFGLNLDYRQLVHQMIALLIEQKSATVILVPHVLGGRASLESDISACESIFAELQQRYPGKLGLARGEYSYDEVKHLIGLCSFFVGARMHACIGALSQCIPTVPVAYSDKFAGVLEAIGFEDLVVDPRRLNADEILHVLQEVYDQRQLVKERLTRRIPEVKLAIRTALANVHFPSENGRRQEQ
jgi:polysaccharide pyruvyl transferase WcaK-like protein